MSNKVQTEMLYVKTMKPHYHEDLLEIILVVDGTIDVYKVERKVTLNKGDFTFVNRGVVHYLESEGASIISCKIKLSEFRYIYDKIEYVEFIPSNELDIYNRPLYKKLNTILVDNIIRLFYLRDQSYLLDEVNFTENQMVMALFRDYQLISLRKEGLETPNEETMNRYYFVVEYVFNNINKKILSQDIVNQLYMNSAYFSQFMKKVSSQGFKEFVLYRKLIHILRYLLEDNYSMNEIASFVGITDMKSFYNIFKKSFHMSPAKWKTQVKTIKDDYEYKIDKIILDDFVGEFNIHKHKDNTISKFYKELSVYKEKGLKLRGARITVNPYEDMGRTIDEEYQVFKCLDLLITVISAMNGTLTLKFPYYYLKNQRQLDLVLKTSDWIYHKNIFKNLKNANILISVDELSELEDAVKVKHMLVKKLHHIEVEIIVEGIEFI